MQKNNPFEQIVDCIKRHWDESGIIYCFSRKQVDSLTLALQEKGYSALNYHAGLSDQDRIKHQNMFIKDQVQIMVATLAFGMGIDKPNVRFVIHYDMPKSLEGYYQETGRAGRDGGEGQCIAFYSNKDMQKLRKFMQGKPISEQEIGKQLLLETAAYAESSVCRRRLLLHYFGEEFMEENCGNCDNCLNPKKQIEAKELLCVVLNAIINTKEKFKEELIVDFLLGKETAEIKDYKLSELDDFDSVEKEESNNLHAIIRQAMIAGFISKDIENYGLLKVTNEGKKYLKKPTSFLITENNEFSDEDDEMPLMRGGGSSALDSTLFSILKDLRKKKSKELKLPPFVIFQDPSLEAMATTYPITIEELKNVPGVGEGKAKRYGEDFISGNG